MTNLEYIQFDLAECQIHAERWRTLLIQKRLILLDRELAAFETYLRAIRDRVSIEVGKSRNNSTSGITLGPVSFKIP